MSQYVKLLFASLCLLFLFLLKVRGENQTRSTPGGQSHLQRPPPHLDLPTSAPYGTPRRGDTPSQVRGWTPTVAIRQEAPTTPLPRLRPELPGCWQDPSFRVGNSPSSKNHSRGLGAWGVTVSSLPHLVFWLFTLTHCSQSSLSSMIRGAGAHFTKACA